MGYDVYLPNTRGNKFSSWSESTKENFYYIRSVHRDETICSAVYHERSDPAARLKAAGIQYGRTVQAQFAWTTRSDSVWERRKKSRAACINEWRSLKGSLSVWEACQRNARSAFLFVVHVYSLPEWPLGTAPVVGVTGWELNRVSSCALNVAASIETFMIEWNNEDRQPFVRRHFFFSFFALRINSFMEMAEFDMPAIIDSILSLTGFKNLHYLGHSRGTTILFALLATKPEYNEKVSPRLGEQTLET